ncbi:MarR family winged helix-turn-helix transcriptional regulator [Deinococcus hohokamensis]|uniref:MarR family winged helix-turn-helix transcriptional regulator n=1 Tax=Deinococcus hohokamensis TaxID=309883 RepID=A0ABV9I5I9_9DEIO
MTDAPFFAEHEAFRALQVLALRLQEGAEEVLRAEGLSLAQFNVLRILRGGDANGLTCGDIGGRLINRDPDVTRLLDRMERLGLVDRARSDRDRRVILTRLSARGRALVDRLDEPLATLHRRQFAHLSAEELQTLLTLLREVPNSETTANSR